MIGVVLGARAVVTFVKDSFRYDRGDGRWLAAWPRAAFSGRFRSHDGHFDPGQRIANVVLAASLLALIVSGIGLVAVSGGPAFVWFLRVHEYATYVATVFIVGHIVVASGLLPGYRGVWRAMHASGGVGESTARRLWPRWTKEVTGSRSCDEGREASIFRREDGLPSESHPGTEWASRDIEDRGPVFPRSEVVARSEGFEVRITEVSPRTHGLMFAVCVSSRGGPALSDVFADAEDWIATIPSRTAVPSETIPGAVLRFGIELRDGRAATNLGTVLWPTPGPPFPILLVPIESSGSEDYVEQRWWLSPVPPEDAFTMFVEWPAGGIPLQGHIVRID